MPATVDPLARGKVYDRLSLSILPEVAGGHAVIFALFALLNAFALPRSLALPVIAGNLVAAGFGTAVAGSAHRGWFAARHATAATAVVHLVSIGVVINAYRLLGDPMRAVFVSLGIVSAGCFLLSLPWLVAVVVTAVAGWEVTHLAIAGEAAVAGSGLFYLLASAILALVIHRVRRRHFGELLANEEALRDLVDHGGMLVQSVGADGIVRFVNHAWLQALGWSAEEVVGRSVFDFVPAAGREHCRQLLGDLLITGERREVTLDLTTRDGGKRTLEGTVTVRREAGRAVYTRGLFQDVTESRRLAGELSSRDELLRQVAEQGDRVFWVYDLDNRCYTYVSPGFTRLSGWRPEELMERPELFSQLFFAEDDELMRDLVRRTVTEGVVDADHRLRHRDGSERWVHLGARLIAAVAGGGRRIVGISEDVTGRQQQVQAYERLAKVDGLTGLANRRRFDEALLGEWGRHLRSGRSLSLLIVDVDHFKRLNDTFGHVAGDDCLQRIARAFERSIRRRPDLVARIGGEEFAFVLPDTAVEGAVEVAVRVHAEVARIDPDGRYEVPTVSVGVASLVPRLGEEADALVTAADTALYAAKRAGRGRTEVAQAGERLREEAS